MFKAIPAIIIVAALAVAAAAVIFPQPAHAQLEKTKTERLLGESLNEFISDENGWTHLHWAALANDAEAVRKLLETGTTPSPMALGDASPFSADGQRKAGLLGHDMEKWTNQRQTPIMVADAFKNTIVVSVLKEHGASFLDALRGIPPPETWSFDAGELNISAKNEHGLTHLHIAAMRNDLTAARWLIASGAEVNAKNNDGFTALHGAALVNKIETAALLLKNGAEVNAKNEFGGTPLHSAMAFSATETAALLLENGAEVNAKDNLGRTPLHEAAFGNATETAVLGNATETAALLLKNGADVNVKNLNNLTPFHLAVDYNRPELVGLLATQADGYTPLHEAAYNNAANTVALLLENGAEVNAKHKDGSTPLHYAAWHNATETAALLLENGAEVNAKDKYGWTPLDWAIAKKHSEMQSLLRARGGECNKEC